MDILSYVLALFQFGICGVPSLLAIAALIHAVRNGADWYWVPIILFLPFFGPVAYFVVAKTSLGGGASAAGADRARRRWARRRLNELKIQLEHWRGPALLVEAGEALLLLGKVGEAERHLREAVDSGAPLETVNFPLATALQLQGRFGEALPLLEVLHAHDPDFKFGEGELALARSLDESGDRERAEKQLRSILERHNFFEARVRLARILLGRGDRQEAQHQIEQVRSDAETLPPKLLQHQKPWIRAARRLRSGTANLPKPGARRWGGGSEKWVIATAGLALLVPAAMLAYYLITVLYFGSLGGASVETYTRLDELANELYELDMVHPPPVSALAGEAELSVDDVALYLRVRRALTPHAVDFDEVRRTADPVTGADDFGTAMVEVQRGIRAMQDLLEAQLVFLEAAVGVLAAEELGPGRLAQLLGVIEWRWLQRPDALIYGLEPHDRELLQTTRTQLVSYRDDILEERDDVNGRRWEQTRQRLKARIADLEETARSRSGISASTVELLETRRAELEDLDPAEFEALLYVTDTILVMDY